MKYCGRTSQNEMRVHVDKSIKHKRMFFTDHGGVQRECRVIRSVMCLHGKVKVLPKLVRIGGFSELDSKCFCLTLCLMYARTRSRADLVHSMVQRSNPRSRRHLIFRACQLTVARKRLGFKLFVRFMFLQTLCNGAASHSFLESDVYR